MKKNSFLFLFFAVIILSASTCSEKNEQPIITNNNPHPRILLLEGEEAQIKQLIAADETWNNVHNAIIAECNELLSKPELERIKVGVRLLATSRELLRRVFYLSYGYRMTGDVRYFYKAEKELLAVSKFDDWNPSHFLDVAEMTMGVAIGYDWLYPALSENSKNEIKEAIVHKGLNPSKDNRYNWWLKTDNNWNQVCNAGMTFGALAVMEDYPALANEIIERAFQTLPLSMEVYKPDGVYPEGYGYWGYGTTFNILFISAVEKALGNTGNLSISSDFLKTAFFLNHTIAPSRRAFNWGDNGTGANLNPSMFWFAEKLETPSVLWFEKEFLEDPSRLKGIRELPAIMIWGKNIPLAKITEPAETCFTGQGANPISMMRTSWTDSNALFLGFKAGSPSVNHGHMDVGSFVMEADGERWAADPGMQNYESLESKGLNIWNMTQDSERWTVFRLNNHSHNVLTIDNQLQQVAGYAAIDRFSDEEGFKFAISDISSVYDGQMQKVTRGVAIKDEKYVVIRDEFTTLDKSTKIKWAMLTMADVELGNNSAALTIGDKKLYLRVDGPGDIEMKTWSTAPANDYDAVNPGTTMVGFECSVSPGFEGYFEVMLIPRDAESSAQFLNKNLADW